MSDDMFDAINAAREASMEGPHSVHGRKSAVMDLLLDSGADFGMNRVGHPSAIYGIGVHYDEEMPKGVVEFRHQDGRTLRRLMQGPDARWYEFDPSILDLRVGPGTD